MWRATTSACSERFQYEFASRLELRPRHALFATCEEVLVEAANKRLYRESLFRNYMSTCAAIIGRFGSLRQISTLESCFYP